MKKPTILWIATFSVVLAFPTFALAQVRQVPPRTGQAPPGQTQPGAPPQLRQVAPRGSAPAARLERSAPQQARQFQAQQQIVRSWKLGIDDGKAPLGVRVRNAYRNTPATVQLGLESGDYILDVQGYPVGYHQGTYYDIGYMMNLYADPQGWVNLNIWNFRTGQANPYWVQLQRR